MLSLPIRFATGALSLLPVLCTGCFGPSRANIELRKQNQQLQARVDDLERQTRGDHRVIAGLRDRQGTLPTLPTTRLAQLFTTHGLEFHRLTGGINTSSTRPADQGLAIYVYPVDQTGDMLKAAGTFDVEAYDLAEPNHPLVGRWHFNLAQSEAAWNGSMLLYCYALICPWTAPPRHADLTVKVTFFDELTQTPFTAQRLVHVLTLANPSTRP